MSEDIQKKPVAPTMSESSRERLDGGGLEYSEPTAFPPSVTVAAWIWIMSGILTLVLAALVAAALMIFAGGANASGKGGGAHLTGALWSLAWFGVFGASLLGMGIQSVRGKARDTLSNGVVSIGLGLVYCGTAFVRSGGGQVLHASVVHITLTALDGLGGALLLAAGVLVLYGRSRYKLWWQSQERRRTGGGGADNPFHK